MCVYVQHPVLRRCVKTPSPLVQHSDTVYKDSGTPALCLPNTTRVSLSLYALYAKSLLPPHTKFLHSSDSCPSCHVFSMGGACAFSPCGLVLSFLPFPSPYFLVFPLFLLNLITLLKEVLPLNFSGKLSLTEGFPPEGDNSLLLYSYLSIPRYYYRI